MGSLRKLKDILHKSTQSEAGQSIWNRHTAAFFLMPLVLLAMLEIMHLTNGNAILLFFFSPFFLLKLLLSYLFLLAIQCFLWCFTQHTPTAVLINMILFYVLGLATEVMISLTGDPLLPTDVLMIGELGTVTSFVRMPLVPFAIVAAIFAVYTYIMYCRWYKHTPRVKMQWKLRICCVVLGLIFFGVSVSALCINYDFRRRVLPKMDVQIAAFNPVENYRENGLILEFFPRIGDMFVSKMEGYNQEKIEEIEKQYAEADYFIESEQKPNVILIQNEALWDVYDMEQTEFNVDPMQNIRKIGKEKNARLGKMASSVFAGGTCLPEFEAITGLNCTYLQSYGYPYVQYITDETPSIVSTYKNNGYQTVAFHPYHKNFYSRNRAYPLLGFDAYYGMKDMDNPEKSGWYISDMEATNFIIDTYEKKTADRLFMFTVTMQNHGGYTPARYEHYDVEIQNEGLSKVDAEGLLDYTQGVYESDVAFKALVDYFRKVDEPTVILMYGDHLPLLGTDGSTYREGGYIENALPFDSTQHEKLYETPYILWANYDIDTSAFKDVMSAGNLGIQLLRQSGLEEVPVYFNALTALYEKLPVVNPYFIYDAEDNRLDAVPEQLHGLQENFQYIQYDILHGKHYVAQ